VILSQRSYTLLIAGVLWLGLFAGGTCWIATFSHDNAVLTSPDIRAFAWVREHTPPGAVFATNYGDGANLIAVAAHRSEKHSLRFALPRSLWYGTPGHGEDHQQRVALAVVTSEIRDLGQDLDQRT
jgi:hypothetical protein